MNERPTQLSLAVFLQPQSTFENFVAEDNAQNLVVHSLKDLASRGQHSDNMLLWGESGSGLSHLLQATCQQASDSGLTTQYLPLAEFQHMDANEVLTGLADLDLICIDDLDVCAGNENWEVALFHLYNQLKMQGGILICAMHRSPQNLPLKLADLRSRVLSAPTFKVSELSDEGKVRALIRRAENMAMDLPPDVANYLISRVSRKADDLFSLLNRLERASMSQHRKLTIPFVKQELDS